MKWKKLYKNCFESGNDLFYFHLRREDGSWVLDIFENTNLLKYVESYEFDNLESSKEDAENYTEYII